MSSETTARRTAARSEGTVRFKPYHLVDRVPDPGWYRLAIVGAYQRGTDQGSLAIKVKFEVVGDREDADDGGFDGVEVWDQFVVDGSSDGGADVALRRLARLYRACGFEVEPDTDYEVSALEGREILGRIVPDEFQGQPRSRVRAFRPLPRRKVESAGEVKEGTPF